MRTFSILTAIAIGASVTSTLHATSYADVVATAPLAMPSMGVMEPRAIAAALTSSETCTETTTTTIAGMETMTRTSTSTITTPTTLTITVQLANVTYSTVNSSTGIYPILAAINTTTSVCSLDTLCPNTTYNASHTSADNTTNYAATQVYTTTSTTSAQAISSTTTTTMEPASSQTAQISYPGYQVFNLSNAASRTRDAYGIGGVGMANEAVLALVVTLAVGVLVLG